MIEKKLITKENLEFALEVQRIIFPKFDARHNYLASIEDNAFLKYYLLYTDGECVGISGFYITEKDKKSGWLGWFGILPEYRRKKLGSIALEMFFEECIENGCTHARLYTDLEDNYATIQFYLKNGMVAEIYENSNDNLNGIGVLVFSKLLDKSVQFEPWGNKNLGLREQIEKQQVKE